MAFVLLGVVVLAISAYQFGAKDWIPAIAASATFAGGFLLYRVKQSDDALTDLRRRFEEREALAAALLAEIENNMRQAHRLYRYATLSTILGRMRDERGD